MASGISLVFVATDGTDEEFSELRESLTAADAFVQVARFDQEYLFKEEVRRGAAAIVDQMICSAAR